MKTQNKSEKVPDKTVGDLLYKSNLQCCVCQEKGVHIHHLNENRFDHRLDNLAFLCFSHHEQASITGGLSRKLSKDAIIKFREHHYQVIENNRKKSLGEFDHPISQLTEESLLTAAKNALIILEIEKIREKYYSADDRKEVLREFYKYSKHSNPRLALDIFKFLEILAAQTRSGMSGDEAETISYIIEEFYPNDYKENEKQYISLAKTCIHIGQNIAYDAMIHLRNLSVAIYGLAILKYVWRSATENNVEELKNDINEAFDFLKSTLKRPERTDLTNAQELVKIYRDDLSSLDLSIPSMPLHLQNEIESDSKIRN